MVNDDRIQKNLWTIVLVFVIIILLGYFMSVSCIMGYCSRKKKEGYQNPLDIDHIGNYFMIGQVGKEYAPRFQVNNGFGGAGQYIMQEGDSGYTGVYGDSRNVKDWKEKDYPDRDCIIGGGPPDWSNQRTPHTWSFSGRYNEPKCSCGYGSCRCCNEDGRGCPVRFDDYSFFPIRRALPP